MKDKGFLVLAQNSETTDYIMQACLLAMSLQATKNSMPISLVTNDEVPLSYQCLFDEIIPIPFGDDAKGKDWKIENRWKLYHATPYQETIVLDTDMLILENIDAWWDLLKNYDVYYTSKVYDYRGNVADTCYYRKAFIENNLPNLFSGFHYFKKNDFAQSFYKEVELIVNNWQAFYEIALDKFTPDFASMDVVTAIASINLDCVTEITNPLIKNPTFTHMKAHCQDWSEASNNWLDKIGCYISPDCKIKLGNYIQTGILHYTQDNFVEKTPVLERYKVLLNV